MQELDMFAFIEWDHVTRDFQKFIQSNKITEPKLMTLHVQRVRWIFNQTLEKSVSIQPITDLLLTRFYRCILVPWNLGDHFVLGFDFGSEDNLS